MSWFKASCISFVVLAGCSEPLTYSKYYNRHATELYNQNDYANAAGAFGECVRINPRDYRSLYYQASSYEQLKEYQQAIATYKTARQVALTTMEGKADPAFREKILDSLAGTIAKSDQSDTEINAAQQDAQTQPSAESLLLLAKIYAAKGDADSAIDAFNRAALMDPKNYYAVRDQGLYLTQMGQLQKAEAPLRRAYGMNQQDEQTNAALRKVGIVPGPSIVEEPPHRTLNIFPGATPQPAETPKD